MPGAYTTAQQQAAEAVYSAEVAYGDALEAVQAAEAAHLAALEALRTADAARAAARTDYRAEFDGPAPSVFAVRASAHHSRPESSPPSGT